MTRRTTPPSDAGADDVPRSPRATGADGLGRYDSPAGGVDALRAVARAVRAQGDSATLGRVLLETNQPDGFDCPGCAWPDPDHRSSFEFCENGAKAVAWEATSKRAGPELFAAHTVTELRDRDDHWLEAQGRLTHPLRYDAATDRYVPAGWADAFDAIGARLRELRRESGADACAFYTSGRTSNEAAFLWQAFVREFGTNNLPDCSNLCHEATSVGLPISIGVGKGTVALDDFARTSLLLSFGHNPGTNHPRMLGTLRELARRGVRIVVFNPLRERGLERFRSPRHAQDYVTPRGVELATHYLQPRIGSDPFVLQGLMKRLLELDAAGSGVLDAGFIAAHTVGFDALRSSLEALDWATIHATTGLDAAAYDTVARLYADSPATIVAYGMGITQHAHGTKSVQQLANLLLLRGNVGRPGAGICPVRGHSNVQGDRTVGIDERPPAALLDRLERELGVTMPRRHGVTVVEAIEAAEAGRIRSLVGLGGNFGVAAPDPSRTLAMLARLDLTVGVHTKLNRTHLHPGHEAWILPALGRTDVDLQGTGPQSVTVEDSMSMVHASRGLQPPPSPHVRSEPAIVAGLAAATLPASRLRWPWLVEDYDRIRALIERCIDGFDDYNARIRAPGGFRLPNAAARRDWRTAAGRATFIPYEGAVELPPAPGALRLTTIRSHDQYNTTVYGHDDRYRGVRGRRDVLFVSAAELAARQWQTGDVVDVIVCGDPTRRLNALTLVEYPVAPGGCAAYFPEANVLVALEHRDAQSHTPAYKSLWVELRQHVSRAPHGGG
jgi:molybdopterin-dependent oxidoreductase alpha subunit